MVLINGAPASGKSTLARLLAQDRALTLVLDIDSIRGSLGLWEQDPIAAGVAARRLALSMASTHLAAGADVIVPQFLGRADFVIELETVAEAVGAHFYEVVLVSSPQEASERFEARSTSDEPNHRDARKLQDTPGAASIAAMYEGLLSMTGTRPRTIYVETVPGRIDDAVHGLRTAMEASTTRQDEFRATE